MCGWDVGNEIAAVAAVDGLHRLLLLERGLHQLRLQLRDQRRQLAHLLLEAEHQLGPGQVDAVLGRQRRDLAQLRQVGVRVAAGAARRPPRAHQAPRLVHAERLRVHPRQLGRDRDRVAGMVVGHDAPPANSFPRGSPWLARCSSSSFSSVSRSCLETFDGTAIRSRTSMSPLPVPFSRGAPRPLTRSILPSVEPAGTLTVTRSPSGVGISMLAPIAASAKVTGTSTTRSSPRHLKVGFSVTWVTTNRSPGSPPRGAASPLPLTL